MAYAETFSDEDHVLKINPGGTLSATKRKCGQCERVRERLEAFIVEREEAAGPPALDDVHSTYIRATEHFTESLQEILTDFYPELAESTSAEQEAGND